MRYYAGIGSRQVPTHLYDKMFNVAVYLGSRKWGLRSGGAGGCDEAFESGCIRVKGWKEIFLPWKGFNFHDSHRYKQSAKAEEAVEIFHPAPDKLKPAARKLMARNYHQVFGDGNYFVKPISLCVCYTPDGHLQGGTSHALRIITAMLPNTLIVNFGQLGSHLIEYPHLGLNFWCNNDKCEDLLYKYVSEDTCICPNCNDTVINKEVAYIIKLHEQLTTRYRLDKKVRAYLESERARSYHT